MAEKLAGKYETPEALEQGYREIRKALALPEIAADKKLVGEGGVFTDHRSLEASYVDANAILEASKKKATEVVKPPEGDPLSLKPAVSDDEGVDAIVKKTGLDGKALADQWQKEGKLTDDQYKAFKEKGGFGKAVVDTFMRGQANSAALAQRVGSEIRASAAAEVGGETQLQNLLAWAQGGGVPADQMDRWSKKVAEHPEEFGDVVAILSARHAKAVGSGSATSLIVGTTSTPTGGNPKTKVEWAALQLRVQQGDTEAMKIMAGMPLNEIERMK